MPTLVSYGLAGLAALAACALSLLALRFAGCRRRGELGRYFLFLSSSALAGLVPNREPLAGLLALLVPWSAGLYAEGLDRAQSAGSGQRRLLFRWSAAVAAAGLAWATPSLLGLDQGPPAALFMPVGWMAGCAGSSFLPCTGLVHLLSRTFLARAAYSLLDASAESMGWSLMVGVICCDEVLGYVMTDAS